MHAAKMSFKLFCPSLNPFLKPSALKTALSSNKQKQSLPPGVIWKQALRLDVWLFAFNHFQFYDVDLVFFFALWTEQREVQKNRILIDHRPCLCSALRASDPKCCLFLYHSFIPLWIISLPLPLCHWHTKYYFSASAVAKEVGFIQNAFNLSTLCIYRDGIDSIPLRIFSNLCRIFRLRLNQLQIYSVTKLTIS